MPSRKTVETAFGAVDEKALEALQNSFETRRLLDAVNASDEIRCRIDGLRDDLLDLHRMAAEVINEDYGGDSPAREEPILGTGRHARVRDAGVRQQPAGGVSGGRGTRIARAR
jgi:hypothetical protein